MRTNLPVESGHAPVGQDIAEATQVSLPPPLTTIRHPLRYAWNMTQQLLWTVLLAYLGMLFFVTVYYLAFEVNPTVLAAWHHLVGSSDVRHLIRNVGEGLFGGLFARSVAWNHYRKSVTGPGLSKADRVEQRLGIPNLRDARPLAWWHPLSLLGLVPVYAVPGFLVGLGIRYAYLHDMAGFHGSVGWLSGFLRVHLSTQPQVTTMTDRLTAGFQANWDQKLIGYLAAFFFARRVASAVIDDLQLVVARSAVTAAAGAPAWWLWRVSPPGYRARCNELVALGTATGAGHQRWWRTAIWSGATVAAGFIVAGEIILMAHPG